MSNDTQQDFLNLLIYIGTLMVFVGIAIDFFGMITYKTGTIGFACYVNYIAYKKLKEMFPELVFKDIKIEKMIHHIKHKYRVIF